MRKYLKYGIRILLAPDQGGGSGGSQQGNPAANQGGATASTGSDPDPFAALGDLNDLDPETRKGLEAVKTQFASLQKTAKETADKLAIEERDRKRFQSSADAANHKLTVLMGTGNGTVDDPVAAAREARLKNFETVLKSKGVPDASLRVQAEIMDEMGAQIAQNVRADLRHELAPMANQMMAREVNASWLDAEGNDPLGMFQIPEVRQATWEQVQIMAADGKTPTAAVVKNLAAMQYIAHQEKNGAAAPPTGMPNQPPPPPSQFVNNARPPMQGANTQYQRVADPRAPKHQLDEATDAALQQVMGLWPVKPKAFRPPTKGGNR